MAQGDAISQMRLATAYVCGRASAGLFTALLDCVANGASCVAVLGTAVGHRYARRPLLCAGEAPAVALLIARRVSLRASCRCVLDVGHRYACRPSLCAGEAPVVALLMARRVSLRALCPCMLGTSVGRRNALAVCVSTRG